MRETEQPLPAAACYPAIVKERKRDREEERQRGREAERQRGREMGRL